MNKDNEKEYFKLAQEALEAEDIIVAEDIFEQLICFNPHNEDYICGLIKALSPSDFSFFPQNLCKKVLKANPNANDIKEILKDCEDFDSVMDKCYEDIDKYKCSTIIDKIRIIEFYKQYALAETSLRKSPYNFEYLINAAKFNKYFAREQRAQWLLDVAKKKSNITKYDEKYLEQFYPQEKIGFLSNIEMFFYKIKNSFRHLNGDDKYEKMIKSEAYQEELKLKNINCTDIFLQLKNGENYQLFLENAIKTFKGLNKIKLKKKASKFSDFEINMMNSTREFEQLVAFDDTNPLALGYLAMSLYHSPNDAQYKKFMSNFLCEKALNLKPDFAELIEFKQKYLLEDSNYFEAKAQYIDLIEKENDLKNTSNDFEKYDEISEIYAKFGRFYKAVEYLSKSLSLRGLYAEVGFNYNLAVDFENLTNAIIGLELPTKDLRLMNKYRKEEYKLLSSYLYKINLYIWADTYNTEIECDIDKYVGYKKYVYKDPMDGIFITEPQIKEPIDWTSLECIEKRKKGRKEEINYKELINEMLPK